MLCRVFIRGISAIRGQTSSSFASLPSVQIRLLTFILRLFRVLPDDAHTMRLAVADVNRPLPIHKNSVRARKPAFEWVTVRAVPALAGPGQAFDDPLLRTNAPYAVALGVREINIPIRPDVQAFRTGKRRRFGWATVTRRAFCAGASDVVDRSIAEIQFVNGVSFAQSQPDVSLLIKVNRARSVQRRGRERPAINDRPFGPCTGKSRDNAGLLIHFADAVIADVADENVPARVKLKAVRLVEHGFAGWTAIPRESRLPSAGDRSE